MLNDHSQEQARHYMKMALALAQRGLGQTWPNPAVGCILVGNDVVVGRGFTQPGGRPHAETVALNHAGAAAKGATAYVTLEPCSHHGETSPCVETLISAGVSKVVIAMEDPDPRVAGQGIAALRRSNIDVDVGLLKEQATFLNAGFFSRIQRGYPLVTLKYATSLDGRIALGNGKSRWITGEAGRAYGHRLRAEYDAILLGSATVVADDPELTCRLAGLEERSPVRIVLDSHLKISPNAKILSNKAPTWIFASNASNSEAGKLKKTGAEIIKVDSLSNGHLNLKAILGVLGDRGLTRLLVEGGARLSASLLKAQLVDRLVWIRSQTILGGDAIPVCDPLAIQELNSALRPKRLGEPFILGNDHIEWFEFNRQSAIGYEPALVRGNL